MEQRVYYKITDRHMIRLLFGLCWAAYFSTYIGRLNYSASLSQIIVTEGFSKGQAGIIGTGFFFAYGVGQFVSGFLGDRIAPRYMVFTGLVFSGISNLAMAVLHSLPLMVLVWCLNGLLQAFIWSPMIRLMFEYLETEERMKACVSLNSSVPIGTMAAYGISAAMIAFASWRSTFLLASVVLLLVAAVWFFVLRRIETYAVTRGTRQEAEIPAAQKKGELNWGSMLWQSGFLFLMAALVVQGALKDGVTTWVPTYISETYGLSPILSVTSTMVIPIFNLMGVYLASFANLHLFHDEVRTAGSFYALCGTALLILRLISGKSMLGAFLMLAIATTAMMAVNTMLIAVLPSYFGVMGRASSVSGLLNSTVYVGGAVSTYGIGALSVAIGWNQTIVVWLAAAVLAMVICFAIVGRWRRYRKQVLKL